MMLLVDTSTMARLVEVTPDAVGVRSKERRERSEVAAESKMRTEMELPRVRLTSRDSLAWSAKAGVERVVKMARDKVAAVPRPSIPLILIMPKEEIPQKDEIIVVHDESSYICVLNKDLLYSSKICYSIIIQ